MVCFKKHELKPSWLVPGDQIAGAGCHRSDGGGSRAESPIWFYTYPLFCPAKENQRYFHT
jgi:hypothetical protein